MLIYLHNSFLLSFPCIFPSVLLTITLWVTTRSHCRGIDYNSWTAWMVLQSTPCCMRIVTRRYTLSCETSGVWVCGEGVGCITCGFGRVRISALADTLDRHHLANDFFKKRSEWKKGKMMKDEPWCPPACRKHKRWCDDSQAICSSYKQGRWRRTYHRRKKPPMHVESLLDLPSPSPLRIFGSLRSIHPTAASLSYRSKINMILQQRAYVTFLPQAFKQSLFKKCHNLPILFPFQFFQAFQFVETINTHIIYHCLKKFELG